MASYYPGQKVNGLEIIDCLTSGAFATSYRVKKGGKTLFLKEYSDPTEASPDFKDFVKQQDNINSRLCSRKLRCLERLLDTFVVSYRYHQVKEFLNCLNLFDYLQTDFDLDNRLFICRLWLGILKEISEAGIVHQDLKPAQILMVKDTGVKLGHRMMFADFDWAVLDGKMVRQVSTPGYATPEHMTGVIPTVKSDLYQSGVVLYEILTGCLPFYRAGELYDPAVARERMERGEFERPAAVQPVILAWASEIITAMLVWDAAKRPAVEEVIKAWDRKALLATAVPKGSSVPVPPPSPASPPPMPDAPPVPPDKIADWIRLRHESGVSMSFSAAETPVTKPLFHGPFRQVNAESGHPIAAYFPSDELTPLFTIRKDADGWKIAGSTHRNNALLNSTPLDVASWLPIRQGDTLEIYSRNEAGVVGKFTFEAPR